MGGDTAGISRRTIEMEKLMDAVDDEMDEPIVVYEFSGTKKIVEPQHDPYKDLK